MSSQNRKPFDIAFSFCTNDYWIANDLFKLLKEVGLNVYFHPENKDFAGGFLRQELMWVYKTSTINVILWSQAYANTPNNSIAHMERKLLWNRHIGKSEYNSLFILKLDNSPLPDEFDNCLIHSINDIGIIAAKEFIVNRLIDCYNGDSSQFTEPSHPNNCGVHRGMLTPCKFRLSSNYKQDGLGRWKTLGDMLVVPLDPTIPKKLKTFLIPSAAAPPFLSHSILLKTNPRALLIKQNTSIDFYKKYRKDDLNGVLFYISKDGMEYPHIYCNEYDSHLNKNWKRFSNP